jgi:hypothetical protein
VCFSGLIAGASAGASELHKPDTAASWSPIAPLQVGRNPQMRCRVAAYSQWCRKLQLQSEVSTAAEGSRIVLEGVDGLPVGLSAQTALQQGSAVSAATQSPGQVSRVRRYAEEQTPLVLQGAAQAVKVLQYAQVRAFSDLNPLQGFVPLERNPPPIQGTVQ